LRGTTDEEVLYFSGRLKQPGMSREWDIKHLLAKYNQIVIDIQELEQLKFRGKAAKECYLCIRSSLPQIVQIAKLVLENKYENL
jgi:PP-loop superfamily ATP-utilizing enzyme